MKRFSNTVSVIDSTTETVVDTIAVGTAPSDVAIGGTRLYVANSASGDVSVIDTATQSVISTFLVGSDPFGIALTDDHVPLIEAGIPTANLIDFTYGPGNGYWHTLEDTPDKLSAATFGMVGAVVAELVYSGG